jgi:AcrR family transcriptional regulator
METFFVFIVSVYIFARSIYENYMRDKILNIASHLFLSLGVKSVTMDDLATKMGISKKTIYEYYRTKKELVKATTRFVFNKIAEEIDAVCLSKNETSPIETLFQINGIVKEHQKGDVATEHQLKKYFPEVYQELQLNKIELMTRGIKINLEKGIAMGLYRKDLVPDIIARFYYSGMALICDRDIFPDDVYSPEHLVKDFTIYHLRAIATPKGIIELENFLANNEL